MLVYMSESKIGFGLLHTEICRFENIRKTTLRTHSNVFFYLRKFAMSLLLMLTFKN